MTQRISDRSAIALNRARSMAPSQKAKMVQVSGITAQVFPSTSRVDFLKNGVVVHAGERFLCVESARFTGWFYIVQWTDGIGSCSCGKPNGCDHTRAACAFTAHRHESDVQRAQSAESEMLAGLKSIADRLIARLAAAEQIAEVA